MVVAVDSIPVRSIGNVLCLLRRRRKAASWRRTIGRRSAAFGAVFAVAFAFVGGGALTVATPPVAAAASSPSPYYLADPAGSVWAFGGATDYGSMAGQH